MKIGFILPGTSRTPCGGYKVVFEYANYLAAHDHDVSIYFDCLNSLKRFHLPEFLRKIGCRVLNIIRPRWFPLDHRVKKVCAFGINDKSIHSGDAIFATAVGTAIPVAKLSKEKGQKYYLIQDYENWEVSDEYVKSTYQLGMTNIVVSKWLNNIVEKITPPHFNQQFYQWRRLQY